MLVNYDANCVPQALSNREEWEGWFLPVFWISLNMGHSPQLFKVFTFVHRLYCNSNKKLFNLKPQTTP